jgi:hypothetical protein
MPGGGARRVPRSVRTNERLSWMKQEGASTAEAEARYRASKPIRQGSHGRKIGGQG